MLCLLGFGAFSWGWGACCSFILGIGAKHLVSAGDVNWLTFLAGSLAGQISCQGKIITAFSLVLSQSGLQICEDD